MKNTFEKLGIPEAERKFLAGVTAQYESEVVYHSLREDLEKLGVVFTDMDTGLREYPELVQKHFGTVIPSEDNKFAALNTAVWSGGSFVYVPKGVQVAIPLQAYFRINTENMGQFERTLIIADEGSSVHYIEGCTAPSYSSDSLHSAVVELHRDGRARRSATRPSRTGRRTSTTWSRSAPIAEEANARVEWIDGNLGSKLTMKYPAVYLVGENAPTPRSCPSPSRASEQHQDAGSKVVHAAPNTTSVITSKSVSKDGGRGSYRGPGEGATEGATGSKVNVQVRRAAARRGRPARTPTPRWRWTRKQVVHRARGHGLEGRRGAALLPDEPRPRRSTTATVTMVVNGFIEPFTKELPMEYAVELNRLIQLEMEGSIG